MPFRKIVCAIDFSARSFDALDKALDMAAESEAELHLVHVVPRVQNLEEYREVGCDIAEHIEAKKLLDGYIRLRDVIDKRIPKILKTRVCIRLGDPATEIVRRAEDERADIIVLGKNEEKGWRRFIAQRVADKVMRQAECPVLAIHAGHH
jgi:nucleotide-binding universal stress UspA family protein